MSNVHVLLVNPPFLRERADNLGQVGTLFVPGKLKVEAMNPGILSIASYLIKKNYSVVIIDLLLNEDFSELEKAIKKYQPMVIGVSSSSAFDYIDSLNCLKIAKEILPNSVTVLGGQQAGPLGKLVFNDTNYLDILCLYEGEKCVEDLLLKLYAKEDYLSIKGTIVKQEGKLIENNEYPDLVSLNEIVPLNYEIYPNYSYFTPFIEESRGCPFGCNFCTSERMNKRRIRTKDVEVFEVEVKKVYELYGDKKVVAILAATFGMNSEIAKKMIHILGQYKMNWTTELRVDCPWEEYIDLAAENGLTVLNVGVESFSKKILQYMGKTNNCYEYLERTKKIIKWFETTKSDVILRTNIILYVGETIETIKELLGFLLNYGAGIKSILCSTVFAVYGTKLYKEFADLQRQHGCELIRAPFWEKCHVYPCKLSRDFSFDETCNLATVIEKMFSTKEGWYQSEMAHYSQKDKNTIQERKDILINERFTN